MKIVVVLLCGVACQVFAQTRGVFPAKILSGQKTVSESSELYIICSTFGTKVPQGAQGFMHLCKNGRVVNKKRLKSNQHDTVFIINVGLHDSGNYSCSYSANDLPLSTATTARLGVIPIRVIANFHPADISVAGPHAVSEGDDVELTCSVSDALQTLSGCPLIPSYLMKNGSVEQIKAFSVARMEVTFTLKDAALRDSGHYSCVVLPSKCTRAEGERALRGKNKVFLEVKGVSFDQQSVIFGVIIGILSVALAGCFIKKRQTAVQLSESRMLEEQAVKHNLEAPSGDSFSSHEENIAMFQQSRVLEEQAVEHNLEASSGSFSSEEENIYCDIEASEYQVRHTVPEVPALTGSDDVNSASSGSAEP